MHQSKWVGRNSSKVQAGAESGQWYSVMSLEFSGRLNDRRIYRSDMALLSSRRYWSQIQKNDYVKAIVNDDRKRRFNRYVYWQLECSYYKVSNISLNLLRDVMIMIHDLSDEMHEMGKFDVINVRRQFEKAEW